MKINCPFRKIDENIKSVAAGLCGITGCQCELHNSVDTETSVCGYFKLLGKTIEERERVSAILYDTVESTALWQFKLNNLTPDDIFLLMLCTDNGYVVETNDGHLHVCEAASDGEESMAIHAANVDAGEKLLLKVIDYFRLGGYKHDKERLVVRREQGEDYCSDEEAKEHVELNRTHVHCRTEQEPTPLKARMVSPTHIFSFANNAIVLPKGNVSLFELKKFAKQLSSMIDSLLDKRTDHDDEQIK